MFGEFMNDILPLLLELKCISFCAADINFHIIIHCRGNSVLICRLHGSVVGETLASFAEIGEPEGVFVVVQFAMPTPCARGGFYSFNT